MTDRLTYDQYTKVVHAIAAHRTEQATTSELASSYYTAQVDDLYELNDPDLLAAMRAAGINLEDL